MRRVGLFVLLIALCVIVGVAVGQTKAKRCTVTFSCWGTEAPIVTTNEINDHQVTAAVSENEARKIIAQLQAQLD